MKNLLNPSTLSRRQFLTRVAGAGAAGLAFPYLAPRGWTAESGPAWRVAVVGAGGRGNWVANELNRAGAVCPCFAEVDEQRSGRVLELWPEAVRFQDYRKMFEKMSGEFDAVAVATPDHHHFPAALLSLQHSKGCYVEKPLALSIEETKVLANEAASRKLPTQVGNQGQANMGNRLTYSWIKGGHLGQLQEVRAWTNRPIWPQGLERPDGEEPVPEGLDWDVWLGPAPFRPFRHEPSTNNGQRGLYHPFNWRGWWDFGAGALGDMGAHILNAIFWVLYPKRPLSITCLESSGFNGDSLPRNAALKYLFTGEDGAELPIYWTEGGARPERPADLEEDREIPASGIFYHGSSASIMSDTYGGSARIFPETRMQEIGRPDLLVEPSPGHVLEWAQACREEAAWDSPLSSFHGIGGYVNKMLCLGVLGYRLEPGESIEWDANAEAFKNRPDLNMFLRRSYQEGWDFRG